MTSHALLEKISAMRRDSFIEAVVRVHGLDATDLLRLWDDPADADDAASDKFESEPSQDAIDKLVALIRDVRAKSDEL